MGCIDMKVLFLMLHMTSDLNSSNLYLDLAMEFDNKGHEVHIIAPGNNVNRAGMYIERCLKVLRVPTLKQRGVGNVLKKGFFSTIATLSV